MRILLDECIPRRLKHTIVEHEVMTVVEAGWSGTKNGALLALAAAEFDVFVTVDQNLQYQQNLRESSLTVVVLVASDNRLESLRAIVPDLLRFLATAPACGVYRLPDDTAATESSSS